MHARVRGEEVRRASSTFIASTSPMLFSRQQHRERLGVEAPPAAHVAQHLHVRQEAHLDRLHALALAGLAAAAGGVEGEAAGGVAADARLGGAGVDAADLVPEADVGRRARARRLADRRLIDFEHPVEVLRARAPRRSRAGRPARRAAPARAAAAPFSPSEALQVRVQHVARHGRLAGTGHAGDHHQAAERDAHVDAAHVVQRDALERQHGRGGVDGAQRLRRVQQRRAQEAPGDRARIADQVLHRAGADHLAAAHARAGTQVEHVIGAADGVLVVLDHDQRVAMTGELAQGRRAGSRCRAGAGRWSARRARSTRPAGSSPAARRGGCAAPRRPRASARRGRAAGSRVPRARGTSGARGSRPAGRARSRARAARGAACAKNSGSRSTGSAASAAIERSRKRTASAVGIEALAVAAPQACGSRSYHSFHQRSSPLCSASKPAISTPVPKQLSHQPCLELKENRRGSSSAKLRPQAGQARLVENTVTRLALRPEHVHQPLAEVERARERCSAVPPRSSR